MRVVVFGSINLDLVVRAARLPAPGETVAGSSFTAVPGGKGANQAVAVARLGVPALLVGRVGNDGFGADLLAALQRAGVDRSGVVVTPGPSGVALITVDEAGANSIVVVPGANGQVGADDLAHLDIALEGASVLLLQLELPLEVVAAAARLARRRGVMVILDPAPARPLPPELYDTVDLLTPNEHEAATLTGITTDSLEGVAHAAALLRARGGASVLVKCGARGLYWDGGGQTRHWPAFPVVAVDSVAAGDACNGALAVALVEGRPWDEAIGWGLAAGALAVTRPGAQSAMPTREEVLALLAG